MNPTSNKSDFEDLTTSLKDLAYSYLEKYSCVYTFIWIFNNSYIFRFLLNIN